MMKLLFRAAFLLGVAYFIRSLREEERREQLARLPATLMERCMEMMPEDSPPRVMISSLQRLQEQNEQIVGVVRELNERLQVLLREQNDLLRERLPAQGSSSLD